MLEKYVPLDILWETIRKLMMRRVPAVKTFVPSDFVKVFPPPRSGQAFVAPTYVRVSSGELWIAPKAFMVALIEGFLPDALMAYDKTRYLGKSGKKRDSFRFGLNNYSAASLEVYHTALVHFLAWSEMRGIEVSDSERFNYTRSHGRPEI